MAVYEDLPSHLLLSTRNLIATTNDELYHGSDSEDLLHEPTGTEWDYSGLPDPMVFRQFVDATDYCFGYSD
jgi:hypothetical protein